MSVRNYQQHELLIEQLENINPISRKSITIISNYIETYNLHTFKLLESSGTNVVILSDDVDFVIQIYNSKELFKRIHHLILDIFTNPYVSINRLHRCDFKQEEIKKKRRYFYDVREYVVQPVDFNQTTFFWEVITPLNS